MLNRFMASALDSTDPADDRPSMATRSIYEELRRRVCMVRYPYGALLRETELADAFGVSRTPVREALQRLKTDGLVETRHGVGSIVLAGDPSTFEDTYALRLEIALLFGKLSQRTCPAEAVARMEAVQDGLETLKRTRDLDLFWSLNEDRHRIVNSLIENQELAKIHDLYYYKVAPFWFALCAADLDKEVDMLERELTETVFWMRASDMQAVAGTQRDFTALAMRRIRQSLGVTTSAPAAG